jgi:hypothetical protein
MDWMCEPGILALTGKTIAEHQQLTVDNLLTLRDIAPEVPWTPVLQGWTIDDYLRCADLYYRSGINLQTEPIVGVGSVCRRQHTNEIAELFRELSGLTLNLHGFGVKLAGLRKFVKYLSSADSMAWSYEARRRPPLPGCTTHKNCANCWYYADGWRRRVLREAIP